MAKRKPLTDDAGEVREIKPDEVVGTDAVLVFEHGPTPCSTCWRRAARGITSSALRHRRWRASGKRINR
jgi:hypothetical protein